MTNHIAPNKRYPNSAWEQTRQDILLVSSFALWAAVLGLSPILALHLLSGI
jgi:hypothetical protein